MTGEDSNYPGQFKNPGLWLSPTRCPRVFLTAWKRLNRREAQMYSKRRNHPYERFRLGGPTLHCAAAEGGTGLGLGSRKRRLLCGLGPEDYECGWRPSSPRATVTPRVLQCEPSAAQVWCDHVCHCKCGFFPLSPRPGAWPHAWVRADLGWAEEEMVKVWVRITGPHPGGGGRALIPEAPLARFHLWAAPS